MASLSTLPQVVDIDHYAGDTLTLHIKVPSVVVAGRTFTAQVRSKPGAIRLDGTFSVIPNAEGADIVLSAASSLELAKRGPYTGYWDVQLAGANGADPVTTLACGELRVHPDVTRKQT